MDDAHSSRAKAASVVFTSWSSSDVIRNASAQSS